MMQSSPFGGLAIGSHSISGTASSLTEMHGCGGPTVPAIDARSGMEMADAAQVSVKPYPCTTLQHMHTLKKSSTWRASGAPPDTMSLTRPPRRSLTLLKTSLSKKGAASSNLCPASSAWSFLLNPHSNSIFFRNPPASIFSKTPA